MVKALATIKGYYDYGMFAPIQIASVIAMRECKQTPDEQSKIYEHRRDVVCRGLDKLGWTYEKPLRQHVRLGEDQARSIYKGGEGTIDFCLRMMDEAEVALAPGRAFGENGEGLCPHRAGRKRASPEAGDAESRTRWSCANPGQNGKIARDDID